MDDELPSGHRSIGYSEISGAPPKKIVTCTLRLACSSGALVVECTSISGQSLASLELHPFFSLRPGNRFVDVGSLRDAIAQRMGLPALQLQLVDPFAHVLSNWEYAFPTGEWSAAHMGQLSVLPTIVVPEASTVHS